jgi:hypothetical protein
MQRITIVTTVAVFAVALLLPGTGTKHVAAQGVSPVGSWYGFATGALGGQMVNVYMLPTFFQDGNIIANDILDTIHTTAHGSWERTGARSLKANFVWINLNNAPGTARVVLEGAISPRDQNSMSGTVTLYVCGLDQLDLASCTNAGVFPFQNLKRIQVQ